MYLFPEASWEAAHPGILFKSRTRFPTESNLTEWWRRCHCCSLESSCYLFFCCFLWIYICFIHVGTCPDRTCRACRASFELKGWWSYLSTFIRLALLQGTHPILEPKLPCFKIRDQSRDSEVTGRLLLLLSSRCLKQPFSNNIAKRLLCESKTLRHQEHRVKQWISLQEFILLQTKFC